MRIEGLSGNQPPRLVEFTEGEYGDVTHDVAYNYVGGYNYYPFSVLQFSRGPSQQKQITRLTRLLRNDGRILGWSRIPSVHGGSDVSPLMTEQTLRVHPRSLRECDVVPSTYFSLRGVNKDRHVQM